MTSEKSASSRRPATTGASQVLKRVRSGVYSTTDASRYLREMRERHEELQQTEKAPATPQVEATRDALAEVWSELSLADEKIRAMNQELVEAHQWLIDERRRYRELFDFAPDPYLVTDLHGRIRESNRAADELLGPVAGRLTDRFVTSLVGLRDRGTLRTQMDLLPSSTQPRRWDSTLATVPPRAVSITLSADGSRGLLWSLRDVSEQRHQHDLLQSLEGEIARRVAARTEEIEAARRMTEAQFVEERQARQRLEEHAREREELLAFVSHELRSPLHAVFSWAQLMQDSPDPGEMKQALGVIERNARLMATLVDDLLERASLLQLQRPMVMRRIDLPALLGRVSESLEPVRRQTGIRFSLHSEASEVPVLGDAPRLEQVFLNLLSNAFRFTPDGGEIEVHIAPREEHAEVRVRDSGQGIAEEHLAHVFKHFYRGASSARPSRGSLGLGLSVARQIVEAHRGTVGASSPGEGLGSTFLVRLPLAPSAL